MMTSFKADEFSLLLHAADLVASQHSTFTKTTDRFSPICRQKQLDVVFNFAFYFSHACISMSIRVSINTALLNPPLVPFTYFLPVKVTIIVRIQYSTNRKPSIIRRLSFQKFYDTNLVFVVAVRLSLLFLFGGHACRSSMLSLRRCIVAETYIYKPSLTACNNSYYCNPSLLPYLRRLRRNTCLRRGPFINSISI